MEKLFLYLLILLLLLMPLACQSGPIAHGNKTTPPSHKLWNDLLHKWVNAAGMVNYEGFVQDKQVLQQYLSQLSASPPDPKAWSKEEKLAYWINAYNAFTVKLIVDNYPVKSINDLHPMLHIPAYRTVWHKEFFTIGGEKSSLDEIEHKILRKQFNEPCIHFAIVCASFSCPPLRTEAYTANELDRQLEEQATRFINDTRHNKLRSDRAQLSKIFSWFEEDFTKKEDLVTYLNRYAKNKLRPDATIGYLKYDWKLNKQ